MITRTGTTTFAATPDASDDVRELLDAMDKMKAARAKLLKQIQAQMEEIEESNHARDT